MIFFTNEGINSDVLPTVNKDCLRRKCYTDMIDIMYIHVFRWSHTYRSRITAFLGCLDINAVEVEEFREICRKAEAKLKRRLFMRVV